MKIVAVDYLPLSAPLANPVQFSLGVLKERYFALVRVRTDEGLTGWGETFVNFPAWGFKERRILVQDVIAPLLVGENPLDVGRLWQKLHQALYRLGLQWGSPGLILQAMSGVDIALWDILGKAVGQPISRLLGGPVRRSIPLYATGINGEGMEERAQRLVGAGFRSLKLRLGLGKETDLNNLRRLRAAVGSDVEILVDANMAWDVPSALEMLPALEEHGVGWIEEPIAYENVEGLQAVSRRTTIPLAGGENSFSLLDFRRWQQAGVPQIWMPDPTRAGGISGCTKILHLAESSSTPVSLHHYGTDVGFAAALHLMAITPGALRLLRDVSETPLREEVLEEGVLVTAEEATVPLGSGLGVTVCEAVIEKHLLRL